MPVKLVAAIALATSMLALSASSSSAGAARLVAHQPTGFVPRLVHADRFAPVRRTKKAAGFDCVSQCSLYEATINQYFTDVAADSAINATTNVYSVATQYSGIQYSETFGGAYTDGSPFPTTKTCHDGYDTYCVTDSQLRAEIGKVIAANGLPTNSPTTLYFIFTPANVGVCQKAGGPQLPSHPCTTNAFCAYHSSTSSFLYAVEPDDAAVYEDGCGTGQSPAGNNADDTISTISHEQNEAITDPFATAWYSDDAGAGYPEIGDLCAYDFGAMLGTPGTEYNQVINGHPYLLQLEYSNQDSGCVPYLGGPVTAPPFNEGTGPLTDHTGPVMTTNTAYAIYWIPAPPANRALPAISGIKLVGKKLTASRGRWSGLPKYTYRWLRCSSAGTSCKGITKATGSTYTLVKADAHHELEVRVTATNPAGSLSAISAPTVPIKR